MDAILFLRIAGALAGTGAAAWEDARTSFIDDKITLGMAALGAALCLFQAFSVFQGGGDLTPWIWVAAVAALIAVAGFFAWRAGQFGGGDVLLFLGLHLLLPFNPTSAGALLPYPFIVSVLVASSFFGSVWSAAWYAKRLREERALDAAKASACVAALVFAVAAFSLIADFSFLQSAFFGLLFASAFFLSLFKREIMRRVVVKRLRLREVEEEDVLAVDELPKRFAAKYAVGRVLTRAEIVRLRAIGRNEKIVFWPVAKELPRFAPFVFAGLAACLLAGDVVFFVLTH